MTNTS